MSTNVKPIPDGYHSITPYLIINNAAEAIDFYKNAFGAEVLYRLNLDLPERLSSMAKAAGLSEISANDIPVMVERPGHYPVSGGWVVYLNRNMKFVPYPGPFPMTEEFIGALETLSESSNEAQGSKVNQ